MSQQEETERPPEEDQSRPEHNNKEDQSKIDTHKLFLKVKKHRERRKRIASGYEQYNLKHIRIQIEAEQIQLLQQIKAIADSLIAKKRDLLLDDDGVVI